MAAIAGALAETLGKGISAALPVPGQVIGIKSIPAKRADPVTFRISSFMVKSFRGGMGDRSVARQTA